MHKALALVVAAAWAVQAAPALAQGDAAAGEKVFARCKVCHIIDQPKNRVGPHLDNVIGRKAGSLPDFKYSEAMKNSNIVWDETTLDAYLADPKGYIAGNRMAFPGLKNPEDRANVIAYIKSHQTS